MATPKWRRDKRYRHWHDNALKRTTACEICNETQHLQVHHIENGAHHPEKRYDPDNAAVLCKWCHRSGLHILYKKGFRKKTTKDDYRRFKAIAKYYLKKGRENPSV